jgi:amino acid transporter
MNLIFVSLGSIIGSGWLLSVLAAANKAGGASIISWPLAGVIIGLLALVHAELGAAYPLSGGTARWPRLAFGSLGGFTAGWVSWLQAVTIAPIEVEIALSYLNNLWHGLIKGNPPLATLTLRGFGVATGLMALFTVINTLGVRWLAESNRVVVLWKVAVPVLTVIMFVMSFHLANFTAYGGLAPYGAHGVLAALPAGVVFTLVGFEQAVQIGGEVRYPQRNVLRAVIGSVIVATVLYLVLQVAFVGALNSDSLKLGWDNLGKGDFAPYATLARNLNLGWLAAILYIDAFVSPAGTGLLYLGTSARLFFALGQAAYLPEGVTRIRNRSVPYISILVSFAVGLICFLPFPTWQSLVGLVTSATAIMYAFAPITLLALRNTHPDHHRPYRLPAAPIMARLAFIAANEIIYWTTWNTVQKLMLAILAGYLLLGTSYVLGRLNERSSQNHPQALIWIIPWLVGLTVISYLGQYGGTKFIPEWIDLGVVAVFSLVICHVAIQHGLPRPMSQPRREPNDFR